MQTCLFVSDKHVFLFGKDSDKDSEALVSQNMPNSDVLMLMSKASDEDSETSEQKRTMISDWLDSLK